MPHFCEEDTAIPTDSFFACLQDLANALGKTVHALCGNNTINALEALMPEPFGLLHRSLLATALPTVVSSKDMKAHGWQ
jgi:hypothetical protein